MRGFSRWGWLAGLFVAVSVGSVHAETIELVTYYPTQANTGDLHVRSLTVGDTYRNVTPGDGEVLVFDALGIGLPVGNPVPAGPLHVVGVNGVVSSAIFVPGTGAGSEIRVGIGTQNPRTRLDLRGALTLEDVNGAGVIYFRNTQVNPLVPVGLYIRSDDDPATFEAASERVFIGASGNVGIGTAAPTVRLDVAQNNAVRVGNAYLSSGDSTPADPSRWAHFGLDAWFRGDQWIFTNPGRGISLVQLQNDSISFFTNADSTFAGWANRMHINAAGNVGIRTTAPQTALHVNAVNHAIRITDPNLPNRRVLLGTNQGGNAVFLELSQDVTQYNNRTWQLDIFPDNRFAIVQPGQLDRVTVLPNGNVGIGQFAPAHRLQVQGNAGKTVGGQLWINLSDGRAKTDIRPVRDAVAALERLRPVHFRYADWYRKKNPDVEDHPSASFVAQEYAKVFPHSVTPDEEGYLYMNASDLLPYLVRAVQELREENNILRRRMEVYEKGGESAAGRDPARERI